MDEYYHESYNERRGNKKIVGRNFLLIAIGVSVFLALLAFGFFGASQERFLLKKYGKEVTATYVEARRHTVSTSGGFHDAGSTTNTYNGYILFFEYDDEETGYSYFSAGNAIYPTQEEAESHIGDEVRVIIYRNLWELKDNMGKGVFEYGTLWLVSGITFSALAVVTAIIVIIFRKKIFLSND